MDWMLVPLFFMTAAAYASVGFGGGSTYIALLAAWGVSHTSIPQISLVCNLVVVAGGCFHFFRAGHGCIKHLLPFLVTSIPMAFIGGLIPVSKTVFMVLLGVTLLAAGARLLLTSQLISCRTLDARHTWRIGAPAGFALGLISGLVGIGGGIFLSPLLYVLRWDDAKGISAAASLFILLNSLSGLAGQLLKGGLAVDWSHWLPLLLAVFVGGQVGSLMGVHRIPALRIQQLTGVFILSVAVRLIWGVV